MRSQPFHQSFADRSGIKPDQSAFPARHSRSYFVRARQMREYGFPIVAPAFKVTQGLHSLQELSAGCGPYLSLHYQPVLKVLKYLRVRRTRRRPANRAVPVFNSGFHHRHSLYQKQLGIGGWKRDAHHSRGHPVRDWYQGQS